MKAFRFRLDRVLDWRRAEMDTEGTRLEQLRMAVAAIDREKAQLEASRDEEGRAVLASASLYGSELQHWSDYNAAVKRLRFRIEEKRYAAVQAVAAQQQKLLEARRRLRLLENLKGRRLAEWKYEVERQMEAEAPPPGKRPFPCLS